MWNSHLEMAMATVTQDDRAQGAVRFATRSDTGTERPHNEDACGVHIESERHVLVAVADGVSGLEGGEIASQTAIDVTLRAYRQSPASWGPAKRLSRAVQKANIEVHDRALIVTELRGMSTTLTAVVVDGSFAHAAHVGDSRLYLIRAGRIVQKTKDHTVAADKRRMGLVRADRMKDHPDRSTLTRSLGRELIAAVDRISFPVTSGDKLLVCSDGLYNVLSDRELLEIASGTDSDAACSALIERANARRTPDNLTAALLCIASAEPLRAATGWRALVAKLLG
jgi:protein phosphatase